MANKKAGFEPLSRYNGYEIYGTANSFFETSYFWNREVADDSNQFNITIGLNIPSTTGNELCKIDLIGNAGHNVHYTLAADWNASFNSDQIVSWGIGEQYKTFRVVLIEQPSWFVQRDLIMKISRASTLVPVDSDDPNKKRYITKNLDIDADHDEAKLTIYSSKKPPVICVSGSDATVTTAGDQVTFNLSSDQVLADPVSLYYKLSGDLSGSVSGHALGSVTIPAGQSEGSVTFEYTGGGSNDCSVVLDYERNTELLTTYDFDPSVPTQYAPGDGIEAFQKPRILHIDENISTHTNDIGYSGLELKQQQDLPFFTAVPTVCVHGGTQITPGYEGTYLHNFVEQTVPDVDKVKDPVTGNDLIYLTPNEGCLTSPSYVRESFNNTYCGGNRLNTAARRWQRSSLRIEPLVGADAAHNSEFVSLTCRLRSRNRNHQVVFRMRNLTEGWGTTDTTLTASNGEDVTSSASYTFSDGTDIWIWSITNCHQDAIDGWGTWYGAFEDDHGKGIYMIHKVDPTYAYLPAGTVRYRTITPNTVYSNYPDLRDYEYAYGDPIFRIIIGMNGALIIPNVTDGDDINPINRTTYMDNSVYSLDYLRDNQIGMPQHSKQFEQSDTQLSGPPDFWPRLYTRWTPRGNATKNPSLNNRFIISRV